LIVAFAAVSFLIPDLPHPKSHDMGALLASDAGQSFLRGNWR
jgi:hypothetical protein